MIDGIKIHINKYAKFIIDELHKNGYEAYIVGGCVRDVIIGETPSDYDITTNAKPEDVKKIFKKTVDTGIKHGTVSVLMKIRCGELRPYEVTTYRVDGLYEDGRHPKDVKFVNNLEKDLERRDFTVNAMAYNEEEGLIDLFGGVEDIKNKIIKAVGNPKERYEEDALRMLRAIRFSAKLGFNIEKNTYLAIKEKSSNLSKVSKERIQEEISKILLSDRAKMIKNIYETGLAEYICEDFDKLRPNDKYFIKTKKLHIAYASLLYQNIEYCDKILRELKLDNETIKNTKILLDVKNKYVKYKERDVIDVNNTADLLHNLYDEYHQKELVEEIGYDLFFDFLEMLQKIEQFDLRNVYNNIKKMKKNHEPIFIKDLEISGNDLMKIGYVGKEVGIVLKKLIKEVHKDKNKNTKNDLIEISKKIFAEVKENGS